MLRSLRTSIAFAAAWFAPIAASELSAQSVLVVDNDGGAGVSFTDLQQAIDAAAPGDTLLLKDGVYGIGKTTTISNKSLHLIADRGSRVDLAGPLVIDRLDASQTVVVHGIGVSPAAGTPLDLTDCAGPVWIEDSRFVAPNGFSATSPGVAVTNCSAAVFARCTVLGSWSAPGFAAAGNGLVARLSSVHLMESSFHGGPAGPPSTSAPAAGGAGLEADDSFVYAQGSDFHGGVGGRASAGAGLLCQSGGAGGPAVEARGELTDVQLLDCDVIGGSGGAAYLGCPGGDTGSQVVMLGGAVASIPGLVHGLVLDNPVREFEPMAFVAYGPPGDTVWLAASINAAPVFLPALGSSLLIDGSMLTIPLGIIPATGRIVVPGSLGPIPAGFNRGAFFVQLIALSPLFGPLLSGGQMVTVLPAGI